MTKVRKILATILGGLLIGSASSAMNSGSVKKPVGAKIQKIMKALQTRKLNGVQSKTLIDYLDKHHDLQKIEDSKSAADNAEMNVGNWDTWSNWNNWDTWSNWNNWDTWSNWNNWDTWSNWSNY